MDFIHIYSYLYILTWQHSHTAQIVGRGPVECLLTSCTHTGLQGKVSYLVSTYFMHSYWTPSFIYLSPGSTFNNAQFYHDAACKEIGSLLDNGTWELARLPPDRKAIGCRWVFVIKHKSDGSIDRYKARLVAQGYVLDMEF